VTLGLKVATKPKDAKIGEAKQEKKLPRIGEVKQRTGAKMSAKLTWNLGYAFLLH
jgi:hypothetical protein